MDVEEGEDTEIAQVGMVVADCYMGVVAALDMVKRMADTVFAAHLLAEGKTVQVEVVVDMEAVNIAEAGHMAGRYFSEPLCSLGAVPLPVYFGPFFVVSDDERDYFLVSPLSRTSDLIEILS